MIVEINIENSKTLVVDDLPFTIGNITKDLCAIIDHYGNVVSVYAGDYDEDEENIKIIEEYLLKNPLPDINEM